MTTPNGMGRIAAMIEQAQALDFRFPEDTGSIRVEEAGLVSLLDLLEGAQAAIATLLDHYDETGRETTGPRGTEATAIADLAFFARNQIREAHRALTRVEVTGSVWNVMAEADSAQRRLLKSLIALESEAREYEELPDIERRWVVLDESLEIRRVYGQFRRAILRRGNPDDTKLPGQLRNAARRIAILRDRTIYPFLRLDDRRQIHGLQKRILHWLESKGTTQEGRHLWQDLVGFAQLLNLVNSRQELIQHDQAVIQRAWALLFGNDAVPEAIPPALMTDLESTIGRDEALDELLLGPRPLQPAGLKAALERLHRAFG